MSARSIRRASGPRSRAAAPITTAGTVLVEFAARPLPNGVGATTVAARTKRARQALVTPNRALTTGGPAPMAASQPSADRVPVAVSSATTREAARIRRRALAAHANQIAAALLIVATSLLLQGGS